MTQAEIDTNFKEIWALFKETDARFKETERELSLLFKETDKQFKETARQFKETDRQFKETDKKLNRLETLFTGQWGKLIESLAEIGFMELLQSRGIAIKKLHRRIAFQEDGMQGEIDFLAFGTNELVVGEVKTTLKTDDVRYFLEKLNNFYRIFPEYKNYKIYGAVIGLHINEGVGEFAYRKGLFVFKAGGKGTLSLLNDAAFRPKDFQKTPEIDDE